MPSNYHEPDTTAKWVGTGCMMALVVFFASSMGGCTNQQTTNIDGVYRVYESGKYKDAYKLARQAEHHGPADRKLDAAYVAGLSAYRMNRLTTAVRHLTQAAGSHDRQLSGDAMASLGMVYGQMGRYEDATRVLLHAAKRLEGHDAANAYYYAAMMQRKNGQWPQAQTNLILARSLSSDPSFHQQVNRELHVPAFTLQTGAFSKRNNANQAAQRIAPYAQHLQLGNPRVVQSVTHNGLTVSLVHVGQFDTYDSALAARQRLGRHDAIIVPARTR